MPARPPAAPRPLALVTGANRGLGRAVAEALARGGHRVLLSGRKVDALAAEAARLAAAGLDAAPLALDLADPASIDAAAAALGEGPPLDLLVSNAGVYGDAGGGQAARATLATNLVGPVRLAAALSPRLATGARVVLVSSGMGELGSLPASWRREVEAATSDQQLNEVAARFVAAVEDGREDGAPPLPYRLSKALLNRLARRLAADLAPRAILVNAVCPGWVRTEMGGAGAPRCVEVGARSILWATALHPGGPSGGFYRDGVAIPW
jgi:NAD(P)-dependent dehydrogenase (short-subunit alcohol dehydrogenase family)